MGGKLHAWIAFLRDTEGVIQAVLVTQPLSLETAARADAIVKLQAKGLLVDRDLVEVFPCSPTVELYLYAKPSFRKTKPKQLLLFGDGWESVEQKKGAL